MLAATLRRVVEGRSLDEAEADHVLEHIISGQADMALVAALLVALRMKGETPAELIGAARAMRRAAIAVEPRHRPLLDTCGTGGDGVGSLNVSTIAALVAAAAGARVAKHGNRGVSSRCGSADLMEALGVPLELSAEQVAACVDEVGIGFMFAPRFHPAMRHVAPLRRTLGIRTLFNLLGPLSNPARVECHVMGVYDARLVETMADVLAGLGVRRALVVHGHGGMDEIAVDGITDALLVIDGTRKTLSIDPRLLGIAGGDPRDLAGGSSEENARRTREILAGARGAARDAVLLNAAGGLLAAGLAGDMAEGLLLARRALDSGEAGARLERLVAVSRAMPGHLP